MAVFDLMRGAPRLGASASPLSYTAPTRPTPARQVSGPRSSGYMGYNGWVGAGGPAAGARPTTQTQQVRTAAPGSIRAGSAESLNANLLNTRTVAGGAPQTGGGLQDGTGGAGGGAPNALEDLLRGRIRRIRTLGAGERRDITDAGLERGLGRSQEASMEHQRQREMEGITGAEREFQANEFENQRAAAADERRAALERERMQQEMTLSRQRADLERELAERRFQQEAEQNELERQSASERAAMSGGGGEGVRIGYGNELQRATGGGGFGGFSDPSAALERQRQQQLNAQQEAINSRYRPIPMGSSQLMGYNH